MAVTAFVIDVNTPNGVVDGLLYISAVLVSMWVPAANSAPFTALGLMFPMLLGFVLSPPGAPLDVAIANRSVAVGVIWLTAVAVWHGARSTQDRESTLDALCEQLRDAERSASEERSAISEWIRTEISAELQILEWRLRCLPHRASRELDQRSEALILQRAIRRPSQRAWEKEVWLLRRDAGST